MSVTPRLILTFFIIYFLLVFGEWFEFFHGFDTSLWTATNWLTMIGVLVAEAFAAAIMAVAVDKALPASGNRAPVRESKQQRRGSQKYTAR